MTIAARRALFRDSGIAATPDKRDPNVRNYPYYFALAVGSIALGSCGKPPPLTAAEDQEIDQAMKRVKIEQDRTDRVEKQKRIASADLKQKHLINTAPIIDLQAPQIQPNNFRQHSLPDISIPPPSRNVVAETSRSGN